MLIPKLCINVTIANILPYEKNLYDLPGIINDLLLHVSFYFDELNISFLPITPKVSNLQYMFIHNVYNYIKCGPCTHLLFLLLVSGFCT